MTLFREVVSQSCKASVVVPARNEEAGLEATLDALRLQVDIAADGYEVLLLLNNCTDRSAAVARDYQTRWPDFQLHVAECSLEPERAHVGTARRMLMDAACARMECSPAGVAVLSTDADTLVAANWVAANLREIAHGAEVVGGAIHLLPADYEALEPGIRTAYERDRRYQELVAELESVLDPDPHDTWPRHLQHFGASLACTCEAYRRSGGLPPVKPLEDVAFIDALRRVGARIRHSPEVSIATSARLNGRAEVGLSGQLRHWQNDVATGAVHEVDSADWVRHRFALMGRLRRLAAGKILPRGELSPEQQAWVEEALKRAGAFVARPGSGAEFLRIVDCDRLIEQSFCGVRRGEITAVIRDLEAGLQQHHSERHAHG